MKIETFVGKGQIGKIFHESEKCFGDRGKSETGGMHHCLRGMDATNYYIYHLHWHRHEYHQYYIIVIVIVLTSLSFQ